MQNIFNLFAKLAVDIIVPPACCICRVSLFEAQHICPKCWQDMHFITAPICDVLGTPEIFGDEISNNMPFVSYTARTTSPKWYRARAATIYTGSARSCVYRLKYTDDSSVLKFMAMAMFTAGHDILQDADMIIPIPLHWSRFIKRRYNQAALLSYEVSRLSGVAHSVRILKRVKRTKRQVGLTRSQRGKNLAHAFEILESAKPLILNKNLLLIDDVRTTGATLNEAANVLKKAGAQHVNVLTFSVVPENFTEYQGL